MPELALVAVLSGVLATVAVATDGGRGQARLPVRDESPWRLAEGGAGDPRGGEVALVAGRIEEIRGLRFRDPVHVRYLGPDRVPAEVERVIERYYPARKLLATEDTLKMLGLLGSSDDLESIQRHVWGDGVAGYYDPQAKRLVMLTGGGGELDEIVLSHELVHALEDQRFDLAWDERGAIDDRATAWLALEEGTAMIAMIDYVERHTTPAEALGALPRAGEVAGAGFGGLPRYVRMSLTFPYEFGERFVWSLRDWGGGWTLVNYALRHRRPRSTEQLIHPFKYLADERPAEIRPLPVGDLLGRRWRRLASSSVGEFDVYALLRMAGGRVSAGEAASGWGGGRFDLWRLGGAAPDSCASPCIGRDAGVLALEWDTRRDAGEFQAAARRWIRRHLHGTEIEKSGGETRWRSRGGIVAMLAGGRRVTVILAPDGRVASELVAASRGG